MRRPVQDWAIGITCMQRIVKYCRRVLIWLLSVQQLNAFVNTLYIVLLNNVFYLKIVRYFNISPTLTLCIHM